MAVSVTASRYTLYNKNKLNSIMLGSCAVKGRGFICTITCRLALGFTHYFMYIMQVEIPSLELRRPEQNCDHATSSVVIFKQEDTQLLLITNKRTKKTEQTEKETQTQFKLRKRPII